MSQTLPSHALAHKNGFSFILLFRDVDCLLLEIHERESKATLAKLD